MKQFMQIILFLAVLTTALMLASCEKQEPLSGKATESEEGSLAKEQSIYTWTSPPASAIPTGAGVQQRPAIAYAGPTSSLSSRCLVVWEQTVGAATQIYGRIVTPSGGAHPCNPLPFSISGVPLTTGTNYRKPAVAYKPGTRKFLVVWEKTIGATTNIMARCVGVSGDCDALTTPPFDLTLPTAPSEFCPDVAADTSGSGRFLVVYLSSGSSGMGVYGQWVFANCNWCTVPFFLHGTADLHTRSCPAVAYGEMGSADFFVVVYRSSTGALVRQRILPPYPACGMLPDFTDLLPIDSDVPAGSSNDVRPDVAYNSSCDQWITSWVDISMAQPVIYAKRASADFMTLLPPTLEILPAADPFGITGVTTLSVAGATTPAGYFAIAFDGGPLSGIAAGAGFNIYARTVKCDGTLSGIFQEPSTAGGVPDWRPAVAFSSAMGNYLAVWQHNALPAGGDIYGRLYTP